MNQSKNPTKKEIYDLLSKYNALIVHFSSCPKMSNGREIYYPNDLEMIINGNINGAINCSTVMPSDVFDGYERNATGCIGVIVKLLTDESLETVSPIDDGSILNENWKRESATNKRDLLSIRKSITDRSSNKVNTYNEWGVANYEIAGIFAIYPYEISQLKKIPYPQEMPEYFPQLEEEDYLPTKKTIDEIREHFPKQRIFSFKDGAIIEVTTNNEKEIKHDEIYKA